MRHIYYQLISGVFFFLFLGPAAHATPAVVQRHPATCAQNLSRVALLTCTFGSSVTTGNTVCVGAVDDSGTGGNPFTITDNNLNSYTTLGTAVVAAGSFSQLACSANVTGGSLTVTVTEPATKTGFIQIFMDEISGMPSTLVIDQLLIVGATSISSSSPNCGTMWNTNSVDIVISALWFGGGNASSGLAAANGFSAGTFAQNDSCCAAGGLEDLVTSTTGVHDPIYSAGLSAHYTCVSVSLVGTLDTPPSVGTVRQSRGNCIASGKVASVTCSFLSLPTVGNKIVVAAMANTGVVTDMSVADNQGNSYATTTTQHISARFTSGIYCATASTSSGTFTVTVTPTGGSANMNVSMFELRGVASCTADTTGGTNAGSSTSPYSCTSITTTNATDYVLAIFSPAGAITLTAGIAAGSGFTLNGVAQSQNSTVSTSNEQQFGSEEQLTAAAGMITPTFTSTGLGSQGFSCSIAAFGFTTGGTRHRVISGEF